MPFTTKPVTRPLALLLALAAFGSAWASHDSAGVGVAREYIERTGSSGDAYLLYDKSVTPAVTYLFITHTRGLIDLVISKTGYSVVNTSSLSLAPGLQFHLLVYSPPTPANGSPAAAAGSNAPKEVLTVTYSGVTAQAGQATTSTKAMTSTATAPTQTSVPSSPPTVVPVPTKDVQWVEKTKVKGEITTKTIDTDLYDYTSLVLDTPATGSMQVALGTESTAAGTPAPAPTMSVTITKAATWDWSAAFTPTFVEKFDGSPAFGVTALSVPFGTNSNVTIDTVGVFTSGSTSSTSLGEAISYNSVIGSSYINSGHDLFGFAIAFKLTFGISGFNFSSHTFGSTPFFGVGISIPFKTKS